MIVNEVITQLTRLGEIQNYLHNDATFNEWFRKQSPEDQATLTSLRRELDSSINSLYLSGLRNIADKLDELAPSLNDGIKELQGEIKKMEDFIKVTETVGKVVGLISRVVALAAGPVTPLVRSAVASPFAALEERATIRSAEKMSHRLDPSVFEHVVDAPPLKEDTVDGPPKSRPVAPVPVEEVLHGIELTDEKLIITVATGGCTEKDSFHVEVNKGFTRLPPYLVTVYRIKPDDCLGNFEPVRISFSRRELGLEGNVDFRILNRIGNTSNHRLKP